MRVSLKSQHGANSKSLQHPVEVVEVEATMACFADFFLPSLQCQSYHEGLHTSPPPDKKAKKIIRAGETWWNGLFIKLSHIRFPERRIPSGQHNPAEPAEACWRGRNWRSFLPTTSPPGGWNIILEHKTSRNSRVESQRAAFQEEAAGQAHPSKDVQRSGLEMLPEEFRRAEERQLGKSQGGWR